MKNKTFKKSLSVFLAVLMLMSCWVWVPGEHNHVSAVASNVRGVPAIRGSHYAGTTAAYGTPVFDGNLDRWFKFHNKGADYVQISYPSNIYLDKSETLQSAGYFFNVDWVFGSSSDYRILIGANALGDNSQWSGYPDKYYTMTNCFTGYGFDSSVPSGGAKKIYNTSTGGTDYDLRIVGYGHSTQGSDGFNYDGTRHDKYVLYRSYNAKPNTATIYLMGTPNGTYDKKEYNTTGSSMGSYGFQQNYSGGWKENNNSMFKQKSYDQANDGCSSYYEGQYAEMQWFVTVYDKSALYTAVTTADARLGETNKWTWASLQNLKSVLNSYRGVLTTRATNQSAIDTAKNKIYEAINTLELRDFTVTFNTLGGSAVSAKAYKYGDYLDKKFPVTSKTGYTFDGWYADKDGDGQRDDNEWVTNADGSLVNALTTYEIEQDWIIYPHWIPNTYEILFDNLIDFRKWDTTAASHGTITSITDNGFTLSYNNDGADEATSTSPYFPVEAGKSYRVDADYIGDAWDVYIFFYDDNTQSGLGIDFEDGPNRRYSSGSAWEPVFTAPAGATRAVIRLDANGTDNSVRFENIRVYEEGKVVDGLTSYPLGNNVTYDAQYGPLPTPNRENYTFAGWVDKDGNAVSPTDIVKITKNETLYSTWTANNFTVIFEKADGSTTSAQYAYGTPATDIAKPANTASGHNDTQHYSYSWPTISDVTVDVTYKEVQKAENHSFTYTDKDDTNHTASCSCGYSKDEAHSYNSGVETQAPTCGAAGVKTYTCSLCSGTKTEAIEATGNHTHATREENRVEATCGADGSYVLVTYCSVCNAEISREDKTIPATGAHTEATKEENRKEATCGADGSYVLVTYCSKCNTEIKREDKTIPATGEHSWNEGVETKAPTCITAGVMTYTCTVCGGTKTESISATGEHKFDGSWSQFNNGITHRRTCTADASCTAYEEENHNFNGTVKSLDGENYHQYKCEKCDAYGTSAGMNAKEACFGEGTAFAQIDGDASQHKETCKCGRVKNDGHAYGAWFVDPENKNNNEGKMSHICSECNYKETSICNYKVTKTVDATCTDNGYKTYVCSDCGNGYTEVLEALGHSFTNYVSNNNATCLENGTETAKCDRCDATDTVTDEGSALGHVWSDTYTMESDGKDGKHYQICTREKCSVKNVAVAHTWNNGVENPEADCENAGTMNYTCTAEGCGATYTETVNPDGHSFGEWVDEVPAICNKAGTKGHYECSVCHKYFADDKTTVIDDLTIEIAPNNHNWVKGETVAPTCTAKGYTNYKCSYCDGEKSSDFVDPLGHSFSEVTPYKAPTCTETGNEAYKSCTSCGKFFAENAGADSADGKDKAEDFTLAIVDDAHDWNEGKITTEPTCTEKGIKTYTCKHNSAHTREEDVSALDHIDADRNGYCDRENCKELICDHKGQDTKVTDKKDVTCTEDGYTGDTRCAKCNVITEPGSVIPKLGHKDEDKNHACDNGCDVYQGEHVDENTDHKCDYGCKESIGTCEDKDLDHDCDYGCDKYFGTHEDTDTDHACDYGCKETIGTHADSAEDKDHVCDYGCGETLEECVDNDKDHACDNGCEKYFGKHEDTDKDHVCDYGCKESIGTCEDKDLDHDCDYGCGKSDFGTHEDKNTDHKCDYGCSVAIGTCEDKDLDHKCDYGCGADFGTHEDKNKDHKCDYGCKESIGTCEDADKDHDCDYGCDKVYGEHVDADKNHTCDYGCKEVIGAHTDSDTDDNHVCDYGCGAVIEACVDTHPIDGKCDVCGADICKHEDYIHYERVEATCKATGNVEYWHCNTCGRNYSDADCKNLLTDVVIPVNPNAHKAEADYTVMQKATCEADGYKAILCEYCDAEISKETITKREHAYKDNGVQTAATCKAEGVMNTICSNTETDTHAACTHESTRVIPINPNAHKAEDDYTVMQKATCEADGYKAILCEYCDAELSKETIAKREHVYKDNGVQTAATCKAEGVMNTICSNTETDTHAACTHESTRVIPIDPNAHKAEADYTVMQKATCEADGYKAILCEYCDAELSKETIAKRAHVYKDNGVQTAATCKAEGVMNTICSNTETDTHAACTHESTRVIPIDQNAHTGTADVIKNKKPATCTEKGYTGDTYWSCCDALESKGSEIGIDKDAHTTDKTHIDGYKAPTCTTVGATGDEKYDCCNAVKVASKEIPVDANAHTGTADVIKNKKPATCTEKGYTGDTYWSCCDALESKGQTIEALPHTEATRKENVVYPSCGNAGSYDVVTYCSVCSEVIDRETITVPATGSHNFATVKEKVDATCNTEGYIIRVCGCGAEEKEIIPANDSVHVWETDENGEEKWIISKEPTCVSKGEKICYCTVSEGHYKVEYIEPTGHNYEAAENGVVAPSCMNQGYTKYICSKENCGSVEHRDFVAALGHDLVSVVTAPTCEERGYTENYCNRCTYTYTDSYTEATGHADKNGDGKCDGCKENNVSVCSCACHSTNWFIKLIYKIVRFIWKLLKVNADCRCGAIHY